MFGYPLLWWLLGLLIGVAVITIILLLVHFSMRSSDRAGQGWHAILRVPIPWQKHRETKPADKPEPIRSTQDNPWATLTLSQDGEILGVIKCPLDQVCERTIGRSATLCDQVINDSAVSRCHVRVVWEPQRACWYVEDLGSKNGTRLNGLPLRAYSPVPLEQGARIVLGRLELTVSIECLGDLPVSTA
ncbi:MAG: FHA domain-containing protein [Candidatus Competibacteraceae bacterium]